MIFVVRPPLYAAVTHSTAATENTAYKELVKRAPRPFHVVTIKTHTPTIDENEILNTYLIDRATRWSTRARIQTTSGGIKIQVRDCDNYVSEHAHLSRASTAKDATRQYTVHRIVIQIGFAEMISYVIRDYGYKARDSNANPPRHIPAHFIAR